jgi:serine/threonine protein kinase
VRGVQDHDAPLMATKLDNEDVVVWCNCIECSLGDFHNVVYQGVVVPFEVTVGERLIARRPVRAVVKLFPKNSEFQSKEVETLKNDKLKHLCAELLGYTNSSPRIIVTKWYPLTLQTFINKQSSGHDYDANWVGPEKRVCVAKLLVANFLEFCETAVHMDIKPANVVLEIDEQNQNRIDVRFIDLETAKTGLAPNHTHRTKTSAAMCTEMWAHPELTHMFRNGRVVTQLKREWDLYSLVLTVGEVLLGSAPRAGVIHLPVLYSHFAEGCSDLTNLNEAIASSYRALADVDMSAFLKVPTVPDDHGKRSEDTFTTPVTSFLR